jgi:hypothetical protein
MNMGLDSGNGAHDIESGEKKRYKAERKVARRRSDKRKGVKATAVGSVEMTSLSLASTLFSILTPSKATVL